MIRPIFIFGLVFSLGLLTGVPNALAQTKVKAVPFAYVPDPTADPYAERVPNKLLTLPDGTFLLLTRRTATEYAVERYAAGDLKNRWTCSLALAPGEGVETFATTADAATIITYRADGTTGQQLLMGYRIDLASGQLAGKHELLTAPKGRRIYGTLSDDGSKVAVYEPKAQQTQIKAVTAVVYDNSFRELARHTADLRQAGALPSITVRVSNAGDLYMGLLTDGGIQLTVRRYPLKGTEAQVLGVPIGGTYGGHKVYIFDTAYCFDQEGALYAAAICMDEETGDYYSLKVVKYDFQANDMRFAEEFRFTPAYLAEVQGAVKTSGGTGPKRLADTYLTDVLLTPDKQLVVLAERKEEEGENSPHFAKEVLLFGYDEFMQPRWHTVLGKNQQAPANEGYSGIGYRAHVQGNTLHLVALETRAGKTDLFDHPYAALSGKAQPVRALGLNVAQGQPVSYVKDFTTWLDGKTLLAVTRPAKKSTTLRLNKIILK